MGGRNTVVSHVAQNRLLRKALEPIVAAAAEVAEASYAVMSLVGADHKISEFLSFGLSDDRIRQIGRLPEFSGVLGLILTASEPVRIADVSRHPAATGFPHHHPTIRSLLGVAIRLDGETEGILYVGNKRNGEEFTDADAQALVAFGSAAGVAIENSRLVGEQRRRERWLEAGAEMTRLLLGEVNLDEALHLVTHRVRDISGAAHCAIALIDYSDPDGHLVFEAADGLGEDVMVGARVPPRSLIGAALESGEHVVVDDLLRDPRFQPPPDFTGMLSTIGLAMFMPMTAPTGEMLGVLVAGWLRSSPHARTAALEVHLVRAFADQTALALQRVQAQEERERRARWLEAGSGMTQLLLGDVDQGEAQRAIIGRLRDISGADYAGVILIDPTDPDNTVLARIQGLGLEDTAGTRIGRRGLMKRVIETGLPLISDDLPHEEGYDPPEPWRHPLSVIGLGMLMPLIAAGEVIGVLYIAWRRDSPHARLARRETALVEMFAGQTALALAQLRSQEDRSRVRVLEDRDRIASDLHDVVIQRLFAVEMRLQSAAGLAKQPAVQSRVERAIDDLENITREVRSTIFQLHHADSEESSIRSELLYEIDSARAALGFTPRLVIRGPVDHGVPPAVRGELVPAVRNALANAARHASPTTVEVVIRVTGDQVVLTVQDDGADLGTNHESEVFELVSRATQLGGTCDIRSGAGGTILEWHVPLAS